MDGYGMFGGFGWIFMALWWVLIVAGIVALIKWILTGPMSGERTLDSSSKALNILRERYARGEIDDEEFQTRKRNLSE